MLGAATRSGAPPVHGRGGAVFLVRLVNNLNLVLEIKGYDVHNPEQTSAKHSAARKWVTAVNNQGDVGCWDFLVCRDLDSLLDDLQSILNGMNMPGSGGKAA